MVVDLSNQISNTTATIGTDDTRVTNDNTSDGHATGRVDR